MRKCKSEPICDSNVKSVLLPEYQPINRYLHLYFTCRVAVSREFIMSNTVEMHASLNNGQFDAYAERYRPEKKKKIIRLIYALKHMTAELLSRPSSHCPKNDTVVDILFKAYRPRH
jgi:hypothetical protein